VNAEDIKNILRNIPNSVSGDGKTFVAALKNYLAKYGLVTDEKIDSALEELTKKPNHVTNITLLELHAITDGVRSNNIQINWDMTPVNDYAKAEVWYTRAADSSWEKAGEANGTQYVMQGATAGAMYYIRVIAVNSKGVAADFDTAPMANITIKGSQYIPAPPTQFVLTWDEQGPLWKWLFEDNNYVDFFELRLDQNPGVWNDKRLDSTRETWSRANPGIRAGTAYLYVRNIFGEYSEPAVHQFNKAIGGKPAAPILTATLDGVNIKMAGLPLGYTHYKLHIVTSDGEEDYYTTSNSEYIYFFFSGTITVSYCFVDDISDGEWSDTVQADVKTLMVNAENIADNAVTAAKIRANSIDASKIQAGAVTADKIEAGAITAEKLAADSVTSDAIQAGSVIGDKIAANTITGKHFAAANIDLTGALTITGGNVKLSQEGLRCSYDNGRYTLFNNQGMFFYDSNGTAFAGIGRFVVGVAKHDDYIKFRTAWDVTPTVIVIPLKMQISAEGYTASNLFWTTGAIDVTNAGFRIQAYSTLGAGSSGLLVLNKVFLTETNFSGVASGFEIITPLQNATHGNFVVRVNLAGEYWQQDLGGSTWPAPPNIIYHYRLLTYKVELYINDKLTKTEIPPNGTAYDKASIDVAFDVDFESGSTIKIVTSAWVAKSHKPEGNYAVSSSVVSAQYNVQADTIISTGEVAFIATEASNATYDITTDK
jgi:hypothetical protein